MPQRRKPSMHHIPAYEDAGLFKNTIAPVTIELVPRMQRNARQDLVVRGYVKGHLIDVMFAGRRAKQVAPLEARLSAMMSQGRRWARGHGKKLDVDRLRLSLKVEGAFRSKFSRDASGWETRSFHFMVARWTLIDGAGNIDVYGSVPLLKETPRTAP